MLDAEKTVIAFNKGKGPGFLFKPMKSVTANLHGFALASFGPGSCKLLAGTHTQCAYARLYTKPVCRLGYKNGLFLI